MNPLDEQLIAKFWYHCGIGSVPQSGRTVAFFNKWARSPEKLQLFRGMVVKWTGDHKTRMLWLKWNVAKDQEFVGIENPEEI